MKFALLPLIYLAAVTCAAAVPARAQQNPAGLALPNTAKVADRFTPLPPGDVQLTGGFLGRRIDANDTRRLLNVDENDLLDAFERRATPHQDWQGEHVGKFLHAATLAWRYDRSPALRAKIDRVVGRLLKTQEGDGYLGTYVPAARWASWDVWVHKYDLLGLLTYYQYTKDAATMTACRRIGDLLVRTFGTGPGQRDINAAGEHRGLAPNSVLEPIVLLYRATADPRYLAFARYILANQDAPGGPAILTALEKYRSVRSVADAKAYEMASCFNGILELYRATGEPRLLDDMRVAWTDITRNRLYPTGSASSYEVFQPDFHLPTTPDAHICETCFTVTWEQMNLQMLRLTGEARCADEAERSIYNHLLAAQKPSGDDWAYYTPLEGAKPYDSATTCCHSSGPRGIALIPSVATMTSTDGGLVVNLYNSGTATARLPSGIVTLTEETLYPLDGLVTLTVVPQRDGQTFPLRVRIPGWSRGATVTVNGRALASPAAPGTYAVVRRAWKRGDRVTLRIPLPARLVVGDHENAGQVYVARGPLVLAVDSAENHGTPPRRTPRIAATTSDDLRLTLLAAPGADGGPVFETAGLLPSGGKAPLRLVPFADAGRDGTSRFAVWLSRAQAASAVAALTEDGVEWASRTGNRHGSISDGDLSTFRVTYDGTAAAEDWFAVALPTPATVSRVVFAHGDTFHDGGWFDTAGPFGKPRVQVRMQPDGPWTTVAVLDAYPQTTARDPAGLRPGQTFEARFAPIRALQIRVLGKPASGDNPTQAFTSCAELQAFAR